MYKYYRNFSMLNLMLNGGIRRDDVRTLFSNLASTSVGNSIAFSFLINRWDDIEKAYITFITFPKVDLLSLTFSVFYLLL